MRIRTIKPEFFNHESLFDLESESSLPVRIAFVGLWCAADREGRFKWEPRRLGVQILPFDGIDFSRVLDALMTRGFIRKYGDDDGQYGVIPSFGKHQVINNRERESELPDPLNCKNFDACLTRDPRVTHASKAEGKGMEGKGKDLLSDTGREEAIEDYSEEIIQLWQSFPPKSRERSSKKKINDEWRKAKNKPPMCEVIAKVKAWGNGEDWKKDNGQYAPGAHLWIKDRKWESDLPEAAPVGRTIYESNGPRPLWD
jgi:hypothetical protein